MAEYDPNARKVVEVEVHHVDLYRFFYNKSPEESISELIHVLGELREKFPGHAFNNDYMGGDDLYVRVERLENDEEYEARMKKYENNRQAQLLKKQNADSQTAGETKGKPCAPSK